MIKKLFGFLVIAVSILIFPLFSSAASLDANVFGPKDMDVIESTQYFPVPKSSESDKVTRFELEGVDKKTGEIVDEKNIKNHF